MMGVWIESFEQISSLGTGLRALDDIKNQSINYWKMMYPYGTLEGRFDFHRITGRKESPEIRQMDQLSKYTVACAQLAMESSGINLDSINRERAGIILGSAFGCTASNHKFLETLISLGPRRTSPVVFRNTVSNAMAGHLAITMRFLGSNSVFNSGMVSGLQSMAYSFEEIVSGSCDLIISGASDFASELIRRRFILHGNLFGHGCLPLMDGACIVLLCNDQCRRRSKWRLLGYGMGFLNKDSLESGFVRILRQTLDRSAIKENDVEIIQIHADKSLFWIRSSPSELLEKACMHLVKRLPRIPFQENSAIPTMLSLFTSLNHLQKRRIPKLFSVSNEADVLGEVPEHFLFSSIGSDGNTVILALKYHKGE